MRIPNPLTPTRYDYMNRAIGETAARIKAMSEFLNIIFCINYKDNKTGWKLGKIENGICFKHYYSIFIHEIND